MLQPGCWNTFNMLTYDSFNESHLKHIYRYSAFKKRSEIKRNVITERFHERFTHDLCKQEQGLGKDYLSTQWLQLVQQKFCFDWFPWQASICHWSKKKLTKAIPTPNLSHCSKDTVHIRSWTPESWVNLPSLPAESNLRLMCSNGTPVANKGEKSRELQ